MGRLALVVVGISRGRDWIDLTLNLDLGSCVVPTTARHVRFT